MPKASVIIPIYNTEKYLRQCLDSVTNQTLSDIEIICIDDGSTDKSLKILEEYAQKDKRIAIISSKNKGAGHARNIGLKYATGEFLAFLDGDDFYEKNFIQEMYQKAIITKADIIVCAANKYDSQTQEISLMPWSLNINFLPEKEIFNYKDIPNHIFNFGQNWNWNKLYKRSFITKNKIKFQKLYRTNDLLFTCKALVLADKISTIKEPLINYRTEQTTNSQSTNHMHPYDFYKAFKELKKFLINKKIYKETEKSYLAWAICGCVHNIDSINDELIAQKLFEKVFSKGFKELNLKDYHKVNYDEYSNNKIKRFEKFLKKYEALCKQRRLDRKKQREEIFSFKNSEDKTHKILTILGLKLKFRRKNA